MSAKNKKLDMIPKEELCSMYCDKRMSTIKIADEIGVGKSIILRWLEKCNISRRTISEAHLNPGVVKPSKKELEEMYLNKGISTIKIEKYFGVSDSTINQWLKSYDIKIRKGSEAHLNPGVVKPSKKELEEMYLNKGMSMREIAKLVGVKSTAIYQWLKLYNVKTRNGSESLLNPGVIKPSKEELRRMYIDERMNTIKIAEFVGVSDSAILRWLKLYNISIRTRSEAAILLNRKGPNSPTWNPNKTDEERENDRSCPEYTEWRNAVYKRDDYTCQVCNKRGSININAHHLEGYVNNPELRITFINGVTLCETCHRDFHHQYGCGNNTKAQFKEFILGSNKNT